MPIIIIAVFLFLFIVMIIDANYEKNAESKERKQKLAKQAGEYAASEIFMRLLKRL